MSSLIEKAQKEYEELTTRHKEEQARLYAVFKTARCIDVIVEKYNPDYTSVSRWGISIHVYPSAFTSVDNPSLCNFIEEIENELGVEATSMDMPDSNARVYNIGTDVKIYATPKDDATCQRVIVGTKKEIQRVYEEKEMEVPVYEFKC